ncbi:MAG: signal transduction histidine kinase [Planctomycetota bacterium]|jgi:signal transduction histidine kinase
MSLRSKITWVLVAVIGLFALVVDRMQQSVFHGRFQQIEEQEAREHVSRVSAAIEGAISDLDALALGLANFTPLFDYVDAPNADFEKDSLTPTRLGLQGLDLVYVIAPPAPVDESSDDFLSPVAHLPRVLWSQITDPQAKTSVGLAEFPAEFLSPNHPLLRGVLQRGSMAGVMLTEHLPLLVSAQPIRRSDGTGMASSRDQGTLIVGRFLSQDLAQFRDADGRVTLDLWQIDGRHELPAEVEQVLPLLTASTQVYLAEKDASSLYAYETFGDIRNRPEILLRATLPRDITAIGDLAARSGVLTLLTAGATLLLVLMFLLKRIVLDPLSTLTQHAVNVGGQEDYKGRSPLKRTDELGTLSGEFDTMLDRLDEAKRALMDSARRAGMSEIATGILHNVGNVLNSVNISTSLAAQQVDEMSLADLEQLTNLLSSHADDLAGFVSDDPRGKHLLPFLTALSTQLSDERTGLRQELSNLEKGVDHICDLIKSQQAYAIRSNLLETLNIEQVLEEAVRITNKASCIKDGVDIRVDVTDMPVVAADHHRVLEILVNLLQNGKQALIGSKTNAPAIVLSAALEGERVLITVSDNGPGIPAEIASQIFGLGFTTKPTGMGYGLHTAANAATEMDGKLTVSDGHPGAVFTLDIPHRATTQAS